MAFTTEFVMGAGGSVEEIPVSAEDVQRNQVVTLTNVTPPPGGSVLVAVVGVRSGSGNNVLLQIGNVTSTTEVGNTGTAAIVSSPSAVQFTGATNLGTSVSFTGTVYVTRV